MVPYYAEAVLAFRDQRIGAEAIGPFETFKQIGVCRPEVEWVSVVRLANQPYCSISGEIFAGTLVSEMCQLHDRCHSPELN